MVELGITQLSMRLYAAGENVDTLSAEAWQNKAKEIIRIVESKARFHSIFGAKTNLSKAPKELFPCSYTYGNLYEDFRIGYDPEHPEDGVFIGFSDVALEDYLYKTNGTAYELLQALQSARYELCIESLSVIAILDEDEPLWTFGRDWMNGSLGIFSQDASTEDGVIRCNICYATKEVRDDYIELELIKGQSVLTIDKDITFDRDYEVAFTLIVFTGSLAGAPACALTKSLCQVRGDSDFILLIAEIFRDHFCLVRIEGDEVSYDPWFYQEMDWNSVYNGGVIYPRVNETSLEEHIATIVEKGDLFSFLRKIHVIWGDEGFKDLWACMMSTFNKLELDEKVDHWLKRNYNYYKLTYPRLKDLVKDLSEEVEIENNGE